MILGVIDGVMLGVTLEVGVTLGLVVGVTVGVGVLVGVTVGVGEGMVGHVAHIGRLPSVRADATLNEGGSDGIGITHQRVKSWLNMVAPWNI